MKYILYFIYYYYLTTYLLLFSLFFGVDYDFYALNIVSILIMETASNLENLIMPLTYLDNILSGNVNFENIIPSNDKHVSVLSSLFSSLSSSSKQESKYIYKTFNSFIKNKTKIEISLSELHDYCKNKKLLELLFNTFVEEDKDWDGSFKSVKQNLPKPYLLSIFSHIEYLKIWCEYHPFSLDSLVSFITGSKIKTVRIVARHNDIDFDDPWLLKVIEHNQFEKGNWRFEYKHYDKELIIKLI